MMSEELGIYLITTLAASNIVPDFMIGSELTSTHSVLRFSGCLSKIQVRILVHAR